MATKVVYLLWAPFGPGHAERFAAAYRQFEAGAEHELVIAACGHGPDAPLAAALEPFAGIEHRVEEFAGPRIDLKTYREAVDRLSDAGTFLFTNSYTRPLAPDWLAAIEAALALPNVGVVGPGGSYESFYSSAPPLLRLRYLPRFKPFPNPHIRTSCFALTRSSIELIDWPSVDTKYDAWQLEAGRRSVTRQLIAQGRRPLVVGRDGKAYEIDEWPLSATFRSGGQANLLIADLRSDDFAAAGPEEQAKLARMAWGALV